MSPRRLLALSACVMTLFLGLAAAVMRSEFIAQTDLRLAQSLYAHRDPVLVKIFVWITWFGESFVIAAGAALTSSILWIRRKREYLAPFFATVIGSSASVFLAKLILHRPRPVGIAAISESSFSFPSGHAALAAAFYGWLLFLCFRKSMGRFTKASAAAVGVVLILAIGFSRLYLGVHFLSDVVGGYLLGLGWLLIGLLFFAILAEAFVRGLPK